VVNFLVRGVLIVASLRRGVSQRIILHVDFTPDWIQLAERRMRKKMMKKSEEHEE
jgi:hypothetical protein